MVIHQLTNELLLSKMHHQGGNKSILNALETTQNGLLLNRDSGVRVGSQKRVVLVTNGPATENLQSLTWAASRIKALGPEIFLVALGDKIPSVKELVAILSSTDAHFYRISDISAFKQIVDGIPVHIFYRDYYFDD